MRTRNIIFIMGILTWIVGQLSCSDKKSNNKSVETQKIEFRDDTTTKHIIDIEKRNQLVEKYHLLNFPNMKQPILMELDEFFIGNNDEASIAPNFDVKLPIKSFYDKLKHLDVDKRNLKTFAEIKEVMIYENEKLNDNEWFYTDIIYFVGDLTKEEIKQATLELKPDEVEYDNENKIAKLFPELKDKKVVYIWWD
jgi:hypothetical protein